MKKVKIMLTAMVVLGAVGGVLAVNAKREVKYCTTATANGVCPTGATCPNGTIQQILETGAVKCYVATQNTARCASDNPACSLTAKLTAN